MPETTHERLRVESVLAQQEGLGCRAEVILTAGARRETGTTEGAGTSAAMVTLVAEATLIAILKLEPNLPRSEIDATSITQVGRHEVAAAAVLVLGPQGDEVLVGSALMGEAGPYDAVARAVLDATNRRLTYLAQ